MCLKLVFPQGNNTSNVTVENETGKKEQQQLLETEQQ